MRLDAIKKMLLLLTLVVMPTMILQAGESYIQTLSGKLKKGDSCTVIDDKFLHLPLADWNRLNHLSVDNIISFELRFDTAVMYYSRSFSCKLNVSIKYFTSRDQQTPEEINNIDLVIRYDTAKGSTFPSNAFYKFKNAFKVVVVINSITSQEWGEEIPAAFRLKNQILVERKYPFSPAVKGGIHLATSDGSSDGFSEGSGMMAQRMAVGKTEKQLTVSWDATDFDNAEEYDVEWTYIDGASTTAADILATYTSAGVINIPDEIMAGWMRYNATRVTVSTLKYTINIPYRDGYVLFRVRSVYHRVETGVREHSPWVYKDVEGSKSLAMRIEETDALEPGLTWQYTAAFAEEGKRKEVITYFDGSLRSRQSVTLSNSDQTLQQGSTTLRQETAIVQETIYDMMGRQAMSILPAPVKSKNIGYYRAFNRNSSDVPLSHTDIQLYKNTEDASCAIASCDLISTPGTTYNYAGASQYYSPNNPFLDDNQYYFTKFVPDAEKRPYSLTQYTSDNTGRIRALGGPGKTLLVEKGNGTQYHYGKPAQKELDRLFGSEVGDASHYLKNMVVDANKQVSVSYIDANGKTIATALAGDPAKNTQGIKSATDAGAKISMNQRLVSTADFRRDAAGMLMQSSSTFLAPMPGTYQVNYNINPASLITTHAQGQFCSNCSYEVVVQVVNDCGAIRGQAVSPAFTGNDITCNPNALPATGTVNVEADKLGEYTVNITLRISEEVVKYQEDYYIGHNSDLKTLQTFFDAELQKLDLAGCYTTCEQCKTLGNTDTEFKNKVLTLLGTDKFAGINPAAVDAWISDTWQGLKQKCSLLSCTVTSACEDYLQQMKADVRAGGQYALYAYNETTGQYSLLESNINVMQYYTQHNLPYTLENGEAGNGNALSVSDFIKTYLTHPEWADELVKHHVEYCAYEWCKDANNANKNEASYNFDKTLRERVLTGEDAVAGNYYNRSNMLALLDLDPFFNNGGRGISLKDEMQSDLNNLSTATGFVIKDNSGTPLPGKNIFELIDWMLYCKPAGSAVTQAQIIDSWSNCAPVVSCRSVTAEWELYRNYYLQLKSKYARIVKAQVTPLCTDCYIGRDVLAQPSCVDPGPLNRYKIIVAISGSTGNATVTYSDDPEFAQPFLDDYQMKVRYKVASEWLEAVVLLKKGTLQSTFVIPYPNFTDLTVVEVKCIMGGNLQNCPDNGTTDPGPCPDMGNFTYREEPEDDTYYRWDVSQVYYVHQDGPVTRPVTVTVRRSIYNVIYGTTTYEYPVTIESGQSEVNIGEDATIYSDDGDGVMEEEDITTYDVWVIAVGCPPVLPRPQSTCPNDPRFASYAGKSRIFNDYIAMDAYRECMASTPATAPTEAEILNSMRNQAIVQLDFLKSNWKERLITVRDEESIFNSISTSSIDQLVEVLYEIARKNIEVATSVATVRPASTLPAGTSTANGYSNFQGAFNNIIGASLVQQGFSPYLLDKPYPYDKTPIETNPNVHALNSDICTNLAVLRSRFNTSGYSSFHTWLRDQLREDYMLTETQLTELENRCNTACRYLEQPLILPVALATPAPANADHPFVDCNRINALMDEFAGLFPSLDPAGKLYRILLTNFLNHKLGYALSYSEYVLFKKNCTFSPTAILYNKPVSPVLLPDNFLCVADNIKSAYERAGQEYDRYITIERKRFRNQYIAKCIGNNAFVDLTGDVYEYHYTLYYYDQSGNLVKTIPPEGVRYLSNEEIEKIRQFRELGATVCNGAGIPQTEEKLAAFNNFSTRLQEGSLKSMELWLYNGGSAASRQVRFVTPDNRYLYQAAIHDHKLWVELYSLLPDQSGGISITLSNSVVAELGSQTLQAWSHLVMQSTDFPTAAWDLYLDGQKLTLLPNGPSYPFEWEIQGGFTLPAEQLADLKHLRFYNRLATSDEIYKNYSNSCLAPIGALATQSSPLLFWGRFNIPAPGSETTTGAGNTTEIINRFIVPQHGLPTYYTYNSLNKVVQQTSPDGGTNRFWYDRLGRVVISQHDEQLQSSTGDVGNRYSYTTYDAQGRITEVGEKIGSNKTVTEILARTESFMNDFYGAGTNRQVTQTFYDESPAGAPGLLTNLRKRVAASIYKETGSGTIQQASYFNYDISGNVKTVYQYNLPLVTVDAATGIKRIDYEYDLISGKTNLLKYQEDKGDQFFHKYLYDADNRVIAAYTSRDKLIWNTEATYRYYLHGPLARKELGNDNGSTGKVQGVDYAYTIQGWLKGINSQKLDVNADMAQDGKPGGDFALYARDVMGFSLGYFDKDYSAIGGGAAFSMKYIYPTTLPNTGTGNGLYNGNISNTTLAINKLDNGAVKGYTYRYDQLNRLTQMRMHAIGGSAPDWNNSGILDFYKEDIKYDGNGNILEYTRHGNKPDKILMDKLTYQYNRDGALQLLNNKLHYVQDDVVDNVYTIDIDGQGSDNYTYDKAGNLIKDIKENLSSVQWTAYGKMARIKKGESGTTPASDVTTIDYSYDAMGNRVVKIVKVEKASGETVTTKTFYVRDSRGNVMGIYKLDNDNKLWWQEQHLYGSNRLGVWKPGLEVTATWQVPGTGTGAVVLGQRNYELSNHLGNVMAVITDKKNPLPDGSFEAEVLTATDYYPFGMPMPGRSLDAPGCHDVVQDLTELVGASDLNEGAVQNGFDVNHNGVRWSRMTTTSTITLYNQAIKVENGGGNSDGVVAYLPASALAANTTYIMEFDLIEKSPSLTSFTAQAHTNSNDPYRVINVKTGLGHHSIIFTTPVVLPTYIRLRVGSDIKTAGTYFVIDNFTARKYQLVNQSEIVKANFDAAVVSGVNVLSDGLTWTPLNNSMTTLSVTGTTNKQILVTCTNVNESFLRSEINLAGGQHYILRFTMAQSLADKRLGLRIYARINGVWVSTETVGITYTSSGDYMINFSNPQGADKIMVEFTRGNSGQPYDGYNVPYTIDNFSITRIDPIASQTTIECDPGADPTGDNSIYRYGFNGKENDNEVKGFGNQQDYGMRIYDPRLGRFLSVDPLQTNFAFLSPYAYAANTPIRCIDMDGREPLDYSWNWGTYAVLTNNWNQEVKEIYDLSTNKVWSIMSYPNLRDIYYWKPYDGSHGTFDYEHNGRSNKDANGNWTGRWVEFEKQETLQARYGVQLADGMATFFAVAIAFAQASPVLLEEGAAALITHFVRTGLFNTGRTGWGISFAKEVSKKLVAARGDFSKIDWADVLTGTIADKFKFGFAGKSLVELINAGVDIKFENDLKIQVAFINKDGGNVFIDLTFSAFKLLIGEVAKETKQLKPSEEKMKMFFDQLKTQVKEIYADAKEKENKEKSEN